MVNDVLDKDIFDDEYEDEVDIAISCNSICGNLKDEFEKVCSSDIDSDIQCDEITNTKIDYYDYTPEPDMVAVDADDMIAAERDITYNALEDDELIDIAISGDDDV